MGRTKREAPFQVARGLLDSMALPVAFSRLGAVSGEVMDRNKSHVCGADETLPPRKIFSKQGSHLPGVASFLPELNGSVSQPVDIPLALPR